jgi:hypothetical protein
MSHGTSNNATSTDKLAELVGSKHDCLCALKELSRQQAELISGGDLGSLMKLLAAKQRYINELRQIDRLLEPFRQQDPEQRPWPSIELRQQCAQQAKRCETLLREIVAQEERCDAILRRRRDETAQQLQGMHQASQARAAYHNEPTQGHRLDLTSER